VSDEEQDLINQELPSPEEEGHTMEDLGHKLYSKQHLEYHTEITSPDAMTTADTIISGLIADEFAGTGFDVDMKAWLLNKRINYVAHNRKRASETERMVEASAQKDNVGNALKEKLLGGLDR
jgi:hypothetical protein